MTPEERKLWVIVGQKAGAVAVIASLIWLFSSVFLEEPLHQAVALILLFGGLLVGLFDPARFPTRRPNAVRAGVTAAFVALAIWVSLPPRPEAQMPWEPYSVAVLEKAAAAGKPVMIDFFAEWCPPCHELDQRLFSKRAIVEAAERFVKLRADMTDQNSLANAVISERHAVAAFPTVVFIGSDGKERTNLRLLGYEPPKRFAARLRAVP